MYPLLNSKDYYSIYPPVCQLLFAGASWLFPNNLLLANVFLKLVFIGCEIGTLYFLLKLLPFMKMPQKRVLLYALNPLIILELTGNLHFETLMIFFLIFSLWFLLRNKHLMFGVAYALSVATKLIPLIFGPLLLLRMRWRSSLVGFGTASILLLIMFYPIFQGPLNNFSSSVDLYFRKFEFNASIYYLFRWLGYQWKGYNMIASIGPLLSIAAAVVVIVLAAIHGRNTKYQRLFSTALLTYSFYLFLSTTVHPWYISLCIILSIFTYYRYPIFWSAIIILSYSHYYPQPDREIIWLIAVEYALLYFVFINEWLKIPLMRWMGKIFYVSRSYLGLKKGD